eukprot:6324202-Lingulodinium_polyedra.AAC.1
MGACGGGGSAASSGRRQRRRQQRRQRWRRQRHHWISFGKRCSCREFYRAVAGAIISNGDMLAQ